MWTVYVVGSGTERATRCMRGSVLPAKKHLKLPVTPERVKRIAGEEVSRGPALPGLVRLRNSRSGIMFGRTGSPPEEPR